MSGIILNGVSIDELRKQKTAIQKDASKFISEAVSKAQRLVSEILEMSEEAAYDDAGPLDTDKVEALAKEALTLLEDAELVSNVSGVEYYLPYNEPYGDCDALSSRLEDCEGLDVYGSEKLSAIAGLYSQLESMESKSYMWNSSSVHC